MPCSYLPVSLDSCFQFSGLANDHSFTGTIVTDTTQGNAHDWTMLTDALLEESRLELSVVCLKGEYSLPQGMQHKTLKSQRKALSCTLSITMFGPLELFEEIGSFFQEHEVYLQDPAQCDRDVRYCNPHRLSSADLNACIWTSELGKEVAHLVELTSTMSTPELLDTLTSVEDLPEAAQPSAIRTVLAR